MSTVIWTPAAITDTNRHYEFLEPNNPDAAKRAAQAILKAGNSLEENPRCGTVVQQAEGLRKLMVSFGKRGFVIHYIILEEEILILRVYHGREERPN